jgi:hypothetical protein
VVEVEVEVVVEVAVVGRGRRSVLPRTILRALVRILRSRLGRSNDFDRTPYGARAAFIRLRRELTAGR